LMVEIKQLRLVQILQDAVSTLASRYTMSR
jgi:hypothetical protein